jgi:uncharacterized protein involved in exopolysaccharide biosynthesis
MSDTAPNKPAKTASRPGDEENVTERRTLRDYYIILRERVWISLPIAAVVALGFFYMQARKTPIYEAVATLQFEKPETVVTSQGVTDPSVRSDMDLNTYIHDINSNKVRSDVVESFTPAERAILARAAMKRLPPGSTPPPTGALLGSVDAEPLRNSFLISITVRHEDPEAAALVANRYVEKFMDYLFESVGGKNEDAVVYLKTRAKELQKDSEDAEKQLQEYMRAHNLVSLDKSIDIVSDNLKSVNAALTTARLDMLGVEELVQEVADFRKSGKDLLEISYISTHASVPTLKAQLSDEEQTQAILEERYLERHPKVIDNSNKIAITKIQLSNAVDMAIADLNTRLAAAKDSVAALEKENADQEAKELSLRALSVDFNSLQTRATAAKSYYMEILDRLNQTTRGLPGHLQRGQDPLQARFPQVDPGDEHDPRRGQDARFEQPGGLLRPPRQEHAPDRLRPAPPDDPPPFQAAEHGRRHRVVRERRHLEGDLATNPSLGITKISENLSVLTSGGRSKSPTQILENPSFGQLLEKLKKQFDLIVVDSPAHGRRHRRAADRRAHRRGRLRLPLQPGLPQAHQALHPGADERQERGPGHRAQRIVAAQDRVLLELPLLPELQEVLRRADLRPPRLARR